MKPHILILVVGIAKLPERNLNVWKLPCTIGSMFRLDLALDSPRIPRKS